MRVGDRAAVSRVRFEDIAWSEAFDGVWACASLLHVPRAGFPAVATRIASALRPGGAWSMLFKLGEGERLEGGRLFVDHTEATMRRALVQVPVELAEIWMSADLRPDRHDERWLDAITISARRSRDACSPS